MADEKTVQPLETNQTTVADLAAELGLTVPEVVALCARFGFEASNGATTLTPVGVAVVRGVAKGDIDPDDQGSDAGPRSDAVIADAATEAPTRRVREAAPVASSDRVRGWDKPVEGEIDRYVPRWLRAVQLGSVLVVGFFVWRVFFAGGDSSDDTLFDLAPDLEIGDCFNASPGLWVDTADEVSCLADHDAQAVGIVTLGPSGREYPDLDNLRSEGIVACRNSFDSALPGTGLVVIDVSVPGPEQWAGGDQRVLCNVVSPTGGKLTESYL